MKRNRLGEILLERNLISYDLLSKALAYQKRNGGKIGEILTKLGAFKKEELEKIVFEITGAIPFRNSDIEVDEELVMNFPKEFISKYKAIPIKKTDDQVYIITHDPFDLRNLDDLMFYFNKKVKMFYLTESDFNDFLRQYYILNNESKENEILELFNKMMSRAIEKRASDIHIEQHNEKKLAGLELMELCMISPAKSQRTHL